MKKYLLSFIALSLGIASVAFTNPKPVKHSNPLWFYKDATSANEGDRTHYEALDGQNTGCGSSGSVICVIEAPAFMGGNTPDLDQIDQVVSLKP